MLSGSIPSARPRDTSRRGAGYCRGAPTLSAGVRAAASALIAGARREELRRQFEYRYPNYRRLAQAAGVRLLCGSDAGTPLVGFDDFALGTELLVRVAGYDPAVALASATLWGAQALGVEDSRGTLEPGKLADLVVLREDPLHHPDALRAITKVMLGGRWHLQGELHKQGAIGE